MAAATWIFRIAGLYGLIVLIPGLFGEERLSLDAPPLITHPEFYYGFYGSALVWQLLFLLISTDPQRFRVLMPIAVLEKAAFFIPCLWLYATGRMEAGDMFLGGMIDGALGLAFAWAWWRTGKALTGE